MTDADKDLTMTAEKQQAARWFAQLRDEICAAFEALEDEQTAGVFADRAAGRFTRRATKGAQGGGGEMASFNNGRLFEKVGVNISTVHGELPESARALMGADKAARLDERGAFWAAGISLVAHLNSPHCPAVHMNTRMFWLPSGYWFGGGMDLNPMVEVAEDAAHFHEVLRSVCGEHNAGYYARFKAWADAYFMLPHRGEARGVGGIFFDDLSTGDWAADFAFTRAVGSAFLSTYVPIIHRRRFTDWTEAEREAQLRKRGRYVEFNLLYDRGTQFGLQSGHDADAVLMSLPPVAMWG